MNSFLHIRQAVTEDTGRIAEIYVFSNRSSYYPIFHNEIFSFKELQVIPIADSFFKPEAEKGNIYVYDDNIIKGFVLIKGEEVDKLYVDDFFRNENIGGLLLEYAVQKHNLKYLWVLEKNTKAVSFYERHGFAATNDRIALNGPGGIVEYEIRMELKSAVPGEPRKLPKCF